MFKFNADHNIIFAKEVFEKIKQIENDVVVAKYEAPNKKDNKEKVIVPLHGSRYSKSVAVNTVFIYRSISLVCMGNPRELWLTKSMINKGFFSNCSTSENGVLKLDFAVQFLFGALVISVWSCLALIKSSVISATCLKLVDMKFLKSSFFRETLFEYFHSFY